MTQAVKVQCREAFKFSRPVKIKLVAKFWLLALRHIKPMDQHAQAQHMKPIYFKGVSALPWWQGKRQAQTRTNTT